MLRKIFAVTLVFALMLVMSASAQTVDELIAKNIQARGGMEKLKAAKSMQMTGKMMMQGGMEAPFILQAKRPEMARMELTIQGMTMVQAYDGQTAWWIMPFAGSKDPEKMPEDQAKDMIEQADFDGTLVNYKDKSHTVEPLGKEDMEGTEVYKLKVTLKNGDLRYVYLDAENFLELKWTGKRKQQGAEIEVDTYFGDYKTVNGLVLPHSFESKIKGQTAMQMTVEKIELDVAMDDAAFKMPATTKAAESAKQ